MAVGGAGGAGMGGWADRPRPRRGPATARACLSGGVRTSVPGCAPPLGAPTRHRGALYTRPMAVRVALAEDSFIVREGIAQVLAAPEGDIEVVALCSDLDDVLAAVESQH